MSFETYTHDRMLEMESLSPLALVAPGAAVEHVEHWEIFPAQAPLDWRNETEVAAFVAANIAAEDNA